MKISDPASADYGKHWSSQQVLDTFAPSDSSIELVKSWLLTSGIETSRIKIANARNWIYVNVTVSEAEQLLRTEYKLYGSKDKRALACDEYSLPIDVRDHIDFVKPTIQLSHLIKRSIRKSESSARSTPILRSASTTQFPTGPLISSWDLTYCNNYTTPACLRALYKMPNGTSNLSSFGVVEFAPYDTYRKSDLQLYLQQLSPQIPDTTGPAIELANQVSYANTSAGLGVIEALLDLDLAIYLAYPQQVTLISSPYVVTGPGQFSSDYLLESFDAAYCNVAAAKWYFYPWNLWWYILTVGIERQLKWSGQEDPSDPATYIRMCDEFMKLSLMGHTLLFSSGDSGVASSSGCCKNPGCAPSSGSSTIFSPYGTTFTPSFPGSCPWITSVGATRIASNAAIKDCEVAAHYSDDVPGYAGGGGFSNLFGRPKYQNKALDYYFKHHSPKYTAEQYNNTGLTRGYPDISANGVNTLIYYQSAPYLTGGTSASCPIVASLITLINEERIKAGKSVVGFLNPALYANPQAFNDVVEGDNRGCGTGGFGAVEGWDPVTGLGTPDFGRLLEVFMGLP